MYVGGLDYELIGARWNAPPGGGGGGGCGAGGGGAGGGSKQGRAVGPAGLPGIGAAAAAAPAAIDAAAGVDEGASAAAAAALPAPKAHPAQALRHPGRHHVGAFRSDSRWLGVAVADASRSGTGGTRGGTGDAVASYCQSGLLYCLHVRPAVAAGETNEAA
eukprot:67631-Chlamydomonas_euryale.AAC.7